MFRLLKPKHQKTLQHPTVVVTTRKPSAPAWDGVERRNKGGDVGKWDGVERRKGAAVEPPPITTHSANSEPSTPSANTTRIRHIKVANEDALRKITGEWRGLLSGVVALESENQCIPISLGCAQVALVATPSYVDTLGFENVRRTIEQEWLYQVRFVLIAPEELAKTVRTQCRANQERDADFVFDSDKRFKRLYTDMIEESVRMGVSDLHIRTRDGVGQVLVRLDGSVRHWLQLPGKLLVDSLAAGFGHYVTVGTSTDTQFKEVEPQAFMARHIVMVNDEHGKKTKTMEGRYNHRPHLTGLAAVIRLLESSSNATDIPTLQKLGYSQAQTAMLDLAMSRQWGLVIFVGSTGQGKSTTLRTLQTHHIPHAETSIVYTMEMPAEYRYPHAIQFSVPIDVSVSAEENQRKQLAVVKDFLRMDGDRGMLGEIRDRESARIAIEFTQSGHPTTSTIHGNSAIDGLSRMTGDTIAVPAEDLGGENVLNAVVYQRLLPRLCPHCKIPANHPSQGLDQGRRDILRTKFKLDSGSMFVANPEGCDHCRPKGIGMSANGTKGVTVAAEILMPDGVMRDHIVARQWRKLSTHWRGTRTSRFDQEGCQGKTAFEHALYLASQGVVSPLSIEENFEPFALYPLHRVPTVDGEES